MSIEAMAIALHHSRAKGTARLVLIGIANHDGDGGAWPTMRSLAKYAGCDKRQARRGVAKLVELGEVRVDLQAGGDADWADELRPNLYHFLLVCPAGCDRTKHHRMPGDGDTAPLWKNPRSSVTLGSAMTGGPPGPGVCQSHPTTTPTPGSASPTGHARPRDTTPACSECSAGNLTTCAARQANLKTEDRHTYTPIKEKP